MSVIRTQASSQIVINYLATGISLFAVIFIYPLDLQAYGLAQFLIMTAMFLIPFVTFGTVALVVKFYPEYSGGPLTRRGYLPNIIGLTLLGMLLFLAVGWLFHERMYDLLDSLKFKARYLQKYSVQLAVMTFFVVLARVFTLHASNFKKITIPALFNNLLPKLTLPLLVFLVYSDVIGYYKLSWAWIGVFAFGSLGLLIYAVRLGGESMLWRPTDISRKMLRRMISFSSYNGISMMGGMLANRIDIIMVTLLIGDLQNGIYVTSLFIAGLLQIPTNAVWSISSPVIAEAWNTGRKIDIERLYKRSSTNLLVAGVVIYAVCLGNIDAVFQLTANYEQLALGIPVFMFLGAAKLIDMLTSVNTQIIMYSKYFKANTVFILVLGVLNIFLNYYFILNMGIVGASIATLLSVATYNVLKTTFIYFAFGMLPFSVSTAKTILMGAILITMAVFFPAIDHPLLHIAVFTLSLIVTSVIVLRVLKINTDFVPFFVEKVRSFVGRKGNPPNH